MTTSLLQRNSLLSIKFLITNSISLLINQPEVVTLKLWTHNGDYFWHGVCHFPLLWQLICGRHLKWIPWSIWRPWSWSQPDWRAGWTNARPIWWWWRVSMQHRSGGRKKTSVIGLHQTKRDSCDSCCIKTCKYNDYWSAIGPLGCYQPWKIYLSLLVLIHTSWMCNTMVPLRQRL